MPTFSLIIPVYNEEENILPLMEIIRTALAKESYEVIFVDDGSVDHTVQRIVTLPDKDVKVIVFSRNYGQTSALAAGIEAAEGEYIVTLDGDLQNDPADISAMRALMEKEGSDIVVGRRANRQDGMLLRKIPSKIANLFIRHLTKVHIRDYGCTLKLFKAPVAKQLDLYGELHRFIPILGALYGAKISEMDVKHHARKFGTSKYGLGRTFKVISDLLFMYFLQKYRQKPMHLFGTLGMIFLLLGSTGLGYLFICKLLGESISNRPLFYVCLILMVTAAQFISTGFLAELTMRTYYESQNKKPYTIAKILTTKKDAVN